MRKFAKIAAAVLLVSLAAMPGFAARGSADFSRLVILGDSYGAGVVSGSLNDVHQPYSWAAFLARQVGYTLCDGKSVAASPCFAIPLVSYPGLGPELKLLDLTGNIAPAAGSGEPYMTTFARPYNNLSIPGANVGDIMTLTGAQPATSTARAMAQFILRGQGTAIDQALVQKPSFIAVWLGGNDFLGAVLAGTPAVLTPTATFKTNYEALLDKIVAGAPSAGVVVGSLPETTNVPYVTTVPPFIVDPATRQPVLGLDGKPIYYVADLGGGNFGQLPAGSFVVLNAMTKLRTGYGVPAAMKPFPPFNQMPNVGTPLADTDVITPTEMATILARVKEFNKVITDAAGARNIPVADIKGLFDRVAAPGGITVGPINVTNAFVTGGFFSLDGFHLTDLGYLFFANEYIKAINNAYGTTIPLASITQIFSNNGAWFPETSASAAGFVLTSAAADQLKAMWATQTPPPTPVRRRSSGR